jgi:hypothetical protein
VKKKSESVTIRFDPELGGFVKNVAQILETNQSDATRRMLQCWQRAGEVATAEALRNLS